MQAHAIAFGKIKGEHMITCMPVFPGIFYPCSIDYLPIQAAELGFIKEKMSPLCGNFKFGLKKELIPGFTIKNFLHLCKFAIVFHSPIVKISLKIKELKCARFFYLSPL